MNNIARTLCTVLCLLALVSCGQGSFKDLDNFMEQKRSQSPRHIEPIPVFRAYKAFTYSAAGLRSPFNRPIEVREIARLQAVSSVKPDESRVKEYLESYSLDSIAMVGTLEQSGVLWALVQDPDSSVHRVKLGNYVGRNHGRIVETADAYIAVIEIVSDGSDGWIERPRTIALKGLEE